MNRFDGGVLTISLDFELHWGVSDLYPVEAVRGRLEGARRAMPRLLRLFEDFGVRATWAVAGMLLCESRAEIEAAVREPDRPGYADQRLSNHRLVPLIGAGESDDPSHYALSLVRLIRDAAGQELATHTFSHFYALEAGATIEAFDADLAAAIAVARRRGVETRSIVFPRNQYSAKHLEACARRGLTAFRGNPPRWMYGSACSRGESLVRRAARLLEAHVPLGEDNLYTPAQCLTGGGLVNIAASRFLRPAEGARALADQRLRLVESELRAAARLGRLYHLWWHPHNFGAEPDANLSRLSRILDAYAELQAKGMRSLTMAAAAEEVRTHAARAAIGARF